MKRKLSSTPAPLTVEQQLDLFGKQRADEREIETANIIQQSYLRLVQLVRPEPPIDHNCDATFCGAVNEQYFIDRKIIQGKPLHPDVYLCKYGRKHVCNLKYKECVILADMFTNCVCRITGRCYGTSASMPQFTGSRLRNDDVPDFLVDAQRSSRPGGEKIMPELEDLSEEGYLNSDNEDFVGGAGEEEDVEDPFESSLAHNIRDFHAPNSKFVKKFTPKVGLEEAKPSIEIKMKSQRNNNPLLTNDRTHSSINHATYWSRSTLPLVFSNSSRLPIRPTTHPNPPSLKKGAPAKTEVKKPKRQKAKKQFSIFHTPVVESDKWKMECQSLITTLFYSNKRKEIGLKQLNLCITTATKIITNDFRYIREKRDQGQHIVVNHFKIFLNFYNCITVNYTQISAAPPHPSFLSRTIEVILLQWNILINSPLCKGAGTGKLNFENHVLAMLYEMRKGGLVLRNEQLIPSCDYTRTYLPPIDIIEQFGFKKGHITNGLKLLLEAHKSITDLTNQTRQAANAFV